MRLPAKTAKARSHVAKNGISGTTSTEMEGKEKLERSSETSLQILFLILWSWLYPTRRLFSRGDHSLPFLSLPCCLLFTSLLVCWVDPHLLSHCFLPFPSGLTPLIPPFLVYFFCHRDTSRFPPYSTWHLPLPYWSQTGCFGSFKDSLCLHYMVKDFRGLTANLFLPPCHLLIWFKIITDWKWCFWSCEFIRFTLIG